MNTLIENALKIINEMDIARAQVSTSQAAENLVNAEYNIRC